MYRYITYIEILLCGQAIVSGLPHLEEKYPNKLIILYKLLNIMKNHAY